MLPVEAPFKTYTGLDGKPLNNGYVYFGLPNENPITSPVVVYWDAAGTIPASQPLRTVNGYIMRAGTPANVFVDVAYSELVQDSKKRQVFYARTSDEFSVRSVIASLAALATWVGSSFVGFIQAGIGALIRTVQAKLREHVSIDDYQDLTTAFTAISGSEGTGFGALPISLDLLGKEITFTGTVYVPTNVSLINGKLTSVSGKLVFRNPFLANPAIRAKDLYWPFMTGRHRNVSFNCATIISCYIDGAWDYCKFGLAGGTYGLLVLVNSNTLWTEYNSFYRCFFAGNAAAGAGVIFDGNLSGTSQYSVGTGAGTPDGSFGYNSFIQCKTDSTAPTVGIKVMDGAAWYNGACEFNGYARGAGPSGAFLYVVGGTNPGKVAQNKFAVHLESFGTAANVLSIENGASFWYNTGTIQTASPEMTMAQGGSADMRGNAITVTGVVLQDITGTAVPFGDTAQSLLTNHVLRRVIYTAGSTQTVDTLVAATSVTAALVQGGTTVATTSLEGRGPNTGPILSRPNDPRSASSRNWALMTNRQAFGDMVLVESTTNVNDPATNRVQIQSGGAVAPSADNTQTLGTAAQRWSTVYAGTGAINTSDATEKQQTAALSTAEKAVAVRIKAGIKRFKFNDAVAAKGAGARLHIGVMAQDVAAAFTAEGLDPTKYALFCSDTWPGTNGPQTRLGIRYEELMVFLMAAM